VRRAKRLRRLRPPLRRGILSELGLKQDCVRNVYLPHKQRGLQQQGLGLGLGAGGAAGALPELVRGWLGGGSKMLEAGSSGPQQASFVGGGALLQAPALGSRALLLLLLQLLPLAAARPCAAPCPVRLGRAVGQWWRIVAPGGGGAPRHGRRPRASQQRQPGGCWAGP
jgi:hypothetical protein